MNNKVTRLKPKINTLRELYLKSGNQCAFPECSELMINENGTFVGEVCHIEGAKPGSERFNQNHTDEDRRRFENLILMCPKHHKIIDSGNQYTEEILKEMKKNHENKFSNIENKIANSIKDYTAEEILYLPKTLIGINRYFKWGLTDEDLKETINCISEFAKSLKKLPRDSRSLFGIICERVKGKRISGIIDMEFKVSPIEIQKVCKMTKKEFMDNLHILNEYSLCHIEEDWDGVEKIYLNNGAYDGWWEEFKEYCENNNISLLKVLVDLKFNLLD